MLHQLENIATYPIISKRLATGAVHLHGWFYDISTGAVEEWDGAAGEFRLLVAPPER